MTYFPNFGFELFAIAAHLSGRLITFHSFNVNQRQSAPTLAPTRHIEMALLECNAEFTYVAWSLFWRQQVGLCPNSCIVIFSPRLHSGGAALRDGAHPGVGEWKGQASGVRPQCQPTRHDQAGQLYVPSPCLLGQMK